MPHRRLCRGGSPASAAGRAAHVAPDTMSILALWAATASWSSTGIARALICRSRPLPVGYSTVSTAVICPLLTVTRTCTGP